MEAYVVRMCGGAKCKKETQENHDEYNDKKSYPGM
jgi:hypothetical protein